MREAMEPLFYAAGVDIALLGHLHAYEVGRPVETCKKHVLWPHGGQMAQLNICWGHIREVGV